jgi:UDP-N-acetylmuramoylalanine--D-glutamate ligase
MSASAAARRASPAPQSLSGKRVTVVGLGRFGGGLGVTRWLCSQGARVTVSDKAPAEQLRQSVLALDGLKLTLHLGSHDQRDFLDADLLVVNPAVPKDLPQLAAAAAAGVAMTTEMNLFLHRCRAPVIAVTGTVGKSTTTAMIGEILARRHATHVGGNIGRSLLDQLDDIAPDHLVVLEISSFQLVDLPLIGIGPHVALVTNFSPNHLDRHRTVEAYAAAKKNIFRFQSPADVLILNTACPASSAWRAEAPGRVEFFDPAGEPFELAIPGRHNQANAQAAWAAAGQFGIDRPAAARALRAFAGLPHRLQFVAEACGVRYYNDSKCTTPEGGVVALAAFEPRTAVVIVGGYDKGADFAEFGSALARQAKAVVAVGDTRDKIIAAVEAARVGPLPTVTVADSFSNAVTDARGQARPGDVVLLSPACASYDMFTNYEHRGEVFAGLVRKI